MTKLVAVEDVLRALRLLAHREGDCRGECVTTRRIFSGQAVDAIRALPPFEYSEEDVERAATEARSQVVHHFIGERMQNTDDFERRVVATARAILRAASERP